MARLPSTKVIWLVIVLVVITIGSLWFVGYRAKSKEEAQLQAFSSDIVEKQKNLELASEQEMSLENKNVSIDKLADKPIVSTTTSSQQDFRNYGLSLAEAFKPLSQKRESETQAVLSAIDKNDSSFIKAITVSRILHEQVAINLKRVIVPKELESRHFKIASQINLLISRLKNMEQAIAQPTLALKNSQSFNSDYLDFIKSIQTLNQFFSMNGVTFSDQEKMQIFVSK